MKAKRLISVAALRQLEPTVITVGGKKLVLVMIGEEVFAFEPMCTHRDAPLAEGAVTWAKKVLCPWHLGTFDLRDGRVVSGPPDRALRTFPVVVRSGSVYLVR